jgi:hypothetical protein
MEGTMKSYTIKIEPEGLGADQYSQADGWHISLERIIKHLGLDDGDSLFHVNLALIISTDEPRLGTILGALTGEDNQQQTGLLLTPDEVRKAWITPAEAQSLDAQPVELNGKKPRRHASKEKRFACPQCRKLVGELVKATQICKPCHMTNLRLAKEKVAKKEATEGGDGLGGSPARAASGR